MFEGEGKMNYNGVNNTEEETRMNYILVCGVIFFIILMTMQYSLNKIILLLREIKDILRDIQPRDKY